MRGKITGRKRESKVKEEGKKTGGRRKEDWKRDRMGDTDRKSREKI